MRKHFNARSFVSVFLCLAALGGSAHAAGPGLHGRVFALDEAGHYAGVVEGASIEFKDQGGNVAAEATSAANGYYRVDLAPGRYTYKVEAEGYQTEDEGRGLVLDHSEGYEVHDFPLSPEETERETTEEDVPYEPAVVPLGELTGQVVEITENGERVGIPDARVSLRLEDARVLRSVLTRAGHRQTGGYDIRLTAGAWRAAVTAEGFEPFVDPEPIDVPEDGTATRDFVLTRAVPETPAQQGIRGLVRVPPGVAMPEIVVVRIDDVMTTGDADEPLSPDEAGRFSRDLAAGKYRVIAKAEGFRPAMRPLVMVYPGRYTEVELRLIPESGEPSDTVAQPLLVAVTVGERTPQGVRGIPNARVMLRSAEQELRDAPTQTTNEEGEVEFEVERGGAYIVLAQAEGYTPGGAKLQVGPGEPNRSEILLQKPGSDVELVTVTGYVAYRDERSPTGQYAIPGARLFWRSRETQELVASAQSGGEHGSYEVSLPEGEYRVEVAGPERFQPTTEAVTVRRGMRPRTFVLERRGEGTPPLRAVEFAGDVVTPSPVLRGRFVGVPGAVIHWTSRAGADVTVRSGRDGSFEARLYPDTYRAQVSAPGFAGISESVVVETGMDRVRFVLSRGGEERRLASLNLRVVERVAGRQRLPFRRPNEGLFATRPVPNAEVRIVSGRDVVASGQTDGQGLFSADVEPGRYAILVAKEGYDTAQQQVLLTERGETTEIVLTRQSAPPAQQKHWLTLRVVEQVVKPPSGPQQQGDQQQPEIRRPRRRIQTPFRQSTPGEGGNAQLSVPSGEDLLAQSSPRSPLQQLQDRFRQQLDQGRNSSQSSRQVIQPVLGASVRIFRGRTAVQSGQTDRDGMYRVQLDPGTYVVTVSRTGFDTAQQSVIISDRDVTRQIVLRRQQQRGPK